MFIPDLSDLIEQRDILVVRFLDTCTDRRWFLRDHETLGRISATFNDTRPVDEPALLAFVRTEFGPDAYAIY